MSSVSDELSTRDRLLDAAIEAATIHGIAKLSVGDVAKRANLSRQTLYKHFASKDEIVAHAVLREATTMVGRIVEASDAETDTRAAIEAGILTTLSLTREHPLLDRLIRTEPEALLPLMIGDTGSVAMAVRSVVDGIVARRLPHLSDVERRRAADLLARLLVSYAVNAPDDPPEVVASFIATVLTTGLEERVPLARTRR